MALTQMNTPAKKKSLGQNFLRDKSVAERIVRHLDVQPEDSVLEIGPGAGALTRLIAAKKPSRLVLLEKDRYWAFQYSDLGREFEIICYPVLMDALLFSWPRLPQMFGELSTENSEYPKSGNWKLVGNLPYNVASPLIWDIVHQARGYSKAVFMVQKEVGERMAAAPNSKIYGALSVWVQSFATVRKLFSVLPGAFDPSPKVDSVVIELVPRTEALLCEAEALSRLLKICFQQRRKQIGNILKNFCVAELDDFFFKNSLNTLIRPENLTPTQFQILAETLHKRLLS